MHFYNIILKAKQSATLGMENMPEAATLKLYPEVTVLQNAFDT